MTLQSLTFTAVQKFEKICVRFSSWPKYV